MDAGVPISEHIAGVSVGLLMDENKETGEVERYMLPVDIQGVEDGYGASCYTTFYITNSSCPLLREDMVQQALLIFLCFASPLPSPFRIAALVTWISKWPEPHAA